MLRVFGNIFKVPEIRRKFLYTIAIIVVIRVGVQIPVPGVNLAVLLNATGVAGSGGLADFLNLFTGGARQNASIFSLGVMPYITSMIIMQLLTSVVPSLEQMVKEGPEGRKKFQQYGRYATVFVTVIQGVIFANNLVAQNVAYGFLTVGNTAFIFIFTLSVTAGTLTLMWLGEQVNENGIGNGISIIIMANIISRLPGAVYQLFMGVDKGSIDPMNVVIILGMFVIVIGLVVFEEQGLRKIPIQYTNRSVAGGGRGAQFSYLPFKVNPTGVIPIIFASAVLIFPAQLAIWFGDSVPLLKTVSAVMMPGKLGYSIGYFVLILFFAYFYTEIQLNPHDISENLRKSGGFIPGIRPGSKTEEYISYILSRITLPGAIFLGTIALMPTFVIYNLNVPSSLGYLMGGTSLLIMVGVALDTLKQLESQLMMHRLSGFLSKKD